MAGLATAGVLATVDAQKAAAQAASDSLLRTVLDRGKLIVGTGSTNAPWHFENDAEAQVHSVLPQCQVMQIDTQANVLQALESKRVDAAAVDLSTVRWLASRNPDKYFDAGKSWLSMLYGAALRQGDLDWLSFVNA